MKIEGSKLSYKLNFEAGVKTKESSVGPFPPQCYYSFIHPSSNLIGLLYQYPTCRLPSYADLSQQTMGVTDVKHYAVSYINSNDWSTCEIWHHTRVICQGCFIAGRQRRQL